MAGTVGAEDCALCGLPCTTWRLTPGGDIAAGSTLSGIGRCLMVMARCSWAVTGERPGRRRAWARHNADDAHGALAAGAAVEVEVHEVAQALAIIGVARDPRRGGLNEQPPD
jgi:hypothetical protein